jgi:hypothetical protein
MFCAWDRYNAGLIAVRNVRAIYRNGRLLGANHDKRFPTRLSSQSCNLGWGQSRHVEIDVGACSLLAASATALLLSQTPSGSEPFLEKPYLQIADAPKLSQSESLVLLWQTDNAPAQWAFEVRTSKDPAWRAVGRPTLQTVSAPAGEATVAGKNGAKKDSPAAAAIEPHPVYRARLTNLVPVAAARRNIKKSQRHEKFMLPH